MDSTINKSKAPILVVEDNDEDYETTVRALRKVGVDKEVLRSENGDEAIDYLLQRNGYAPPVPAPRPAIILLDLNMPGTDGFEVLEMIKQDMVLKSIPVVVLTTSSSDRDIEMCYRSGANSYIQKPVNLDGFVEAIKQFKDYWFETVVLHAGN
jgi:CheY-like chemotaxis protein